MASSSLIKCALLSVAMHVVVVLLCCITGVEFSRKKNAKTYNVITFDFVKIGNVSRAHNTIKTQSLPKKHNNIKKERLQNNKAQDIKHNIANNNHNNVAENATQNKLNKTHKPQDNKVSTSKKNVVAANKNKKNPVMKNNSEKKNNQTKPNMTSNNMAKKTIQNNTTRNIARSIKNSTDDIGALLNQKLNDDATNAEKIGHLEASQQDVIVQRMKKCWKTRDLHNIQNVLAVARIKLDINGRVVDISIEVEGVCNKDDKEQLRASIERALRSNEFSPLPFDKSNYDSWKTLELVLDPNDYL